MQSTIDPILQTPLDTWVLTWDAGQVLLCRLQLALLVPRLAVAGVQLKGTAAGVRSVGQAVSRSCRRKLMGQVGHMVCEGLNRKPSQRQILFAAPRAAPALNPRP